MDFEKAALMVIELHNVSLSSEFYSVYVRKPASTLR